ncbi:MAG: hypothetical protein IT306_17385 [Chloroflexi bacterium]|nr:hypothetical protein [Chloroflexota bacterium]
MQISATNHDTHHNALPEAFGSFEQPLLLQPADLMPADDDDEILDTWLASLGPREFELILSNLARDSHGRFALEPTA